MDPPADLPRESRMDTPQVHQKFSNLISAILFGNPEIVSSRLTELANDEAVLFFQVYHGLDLPSDVKTIDVMSNYLSLHRVGPRLSGDGFITAIKTENVDLLETWTRIMQNVKVSSILDKNNKKELVFDLFEKLLIKGNEKIAEILIEFFQTHKIDFKISESMCDDLSKNDPAKLQKLLNLAIKLDVNVDSNQASLKKYPEISRKIWKEYYSLLLDG